MTQFFKNLFAKKTNMREQGKLDEQKLFSESVKQQFKALKDKGLSIPIFTL